MNNRFDELTKHIAQSLTRRGALKKFSLGLAGMALACFGLGNNALADSQRPVKKIPNWCDLNTNPCCCRHCSTFLPPDDINWWNCAGACRFACGG